MSEEIYIFHDVTEDKFVAFSDRDIANKWGRGRTSIRGYVAQLDPPIISTFYVEYVFGNHGFKSYQVFHVDSRKMFTPGKIVTYPDRWKVWVHAKDENEAVVNATSAIMAHVLTVGKFEPLDEEDDDELD